MGKVESGGKSLLSRRKVLTGIGGCTAGLSFVFPSDSAAQVVDDARQYRPSLEGQFREILAFSSLLQWLTALELSDSFFAGREPERRAEENKKFLDSLVGILLGHSLGQIERWFASMVSLAASEDGGGTRLDADILAAINSSQLETKVKKSAITYFNEVSALERIGRYVNTKPAELDGFRADALRQSLAKSKEDPNNGPYLDENTRQPWIETLLISMLASAVTSGQWYLVPAVITKMGMAGVLPKN